MFKQPLDETAAKLKYSGPETNPIGLLQLKRLREASEQTRKGNFAMARAIRKQLAEEVELIRKTPILY